MTVGLQVKHFISNQGKNDKTSLTSSRVPFVPTRVTVIFLFVKGSKTQNVPRGQKRKGWETLSQTNRRDSQLLFLVGLDVTYIM